MRRTRYLAKQTLHCRVTSVVMGQSTKSLRDSPLRRVLEPIGR